jgi:beta-glucosidase
MKVRRKISVVISIGCCLGTMATIPMRAQNTPSYLDRGQRNEARVADLLHRMTLDEKIGQMVQPDLSCVSNLADIQHMALAPCSGGDSKPSGENNPTNWLDTMNTIQSWALKTRLKIPLIYGIDAIHGHNDVIGTTIFPHRIGMGATRNPGLVQEADHITALEVAGTGIRWAFAPCIAVAQNERWGRIYESYGQEPNLVSEMAAASVEGFQGDSLSGKSDSVLPVRNISLATAARKMDKTRATPFAMKLHCENCICRLTKPPPKAKFLGVSRMSPVGLSLKNVPANA